MCKELSKFHIVTNKPLNVNVQKHAKMASEGLYSKIQMEKRKTATSKIQSSDKKLKSEEN